MTISFVETLMGLPIGWTTATTGLDAAVMASWRFRQRQLLLYWLGD